MLFGGSRSSIQIGLERKGLTHEKVKGLISALGYGDINRFRPTDSEDFYDKDKLSKFMASTIIFLILEKQNACARCNVVSIDKRYGAFGFESDLVDENFRKKDEETRKLYEVNMRNHLATF